MKTRIAMLLVVLFVAVPTLRAQPDGRAEVRATAGWAGFLDDGRTISHGVVGGAARYYLTPRVSAEGEFHYLKGNRDGHYDLAFVPTVAFDFTRSSPVIPYVFGGVGAIRSTDRIQIRPRDFITVSGSSVSFGGGGGVKVFVSGRWFVSAEARLGFEPNMRVTGSIGYRF